MIQQIKSMVQFTRGSSLVWDAVTTPIPIGVVTFSIDDGAFKVGDGVTTYPNLPVLFTFGDLVAAQGGTSTLFAQPIVANDGKIVVIAYDSGSGLTKYAISTTNLSDLLASISALESGNTSQDSAIAALMTIALSIDATINTGASGNVVTIQNGRYSDSGQSIASIQAQIAAGTPHVSGSHVMEPVFYTTASKSVVANRLALYDNTTYFIDVVGFNNAAATAVFGLTAPNTNIVITNVSGSLFSVKLNAVTGTAWDKTPIVFVGTVDDGTGNAIVNKTFIAQVLRNRILTAVYGGAGATDTFYGVAIDPSNNIICAGVTNSEGVATYDCLVVKFDSNLNILARKVYGGSSADYFYAVAVDSSGNIICAGYTYSEGVANYDALVVKFDTNLNILARKVYGGGSSEIFYGVTCDSLGNVICAGETNSGATQGSTIDCLIVKFDSSLNLLVAKLYGGTSIDYFFAVTVDVANNIIAAGYTNSESAAGGNPTYYDALVVKFDSSLNILYRKVYGGSSGTDLFYGVACDSSSNVICVGYAGAEGTANDALVVKFDSTLAIIFRKIYGGSGNDQFTGVVCDSSGNIICSGTTTSEGLTQDAIMIKFDPSLNILYKKRCGGTGSTLDAFQGVAVDSASNIICAGTTASAGPAANDCYVVRFPSVVPSGTFAGVLMSTLAINDSALTLATSTMTLANSGLTLASATLMTLSNSALTLNNSVLTLVKDTLN